MGETTCVRWRKYGKDRLYVNGPDGARIGWCDLVAGVDHVEVDGTADEFRAVVERWRLENGEAFAAGANPRVPVGVAKEVPPSPVLVPEPVAEAMGQDRPVAVDWEDLAVRRAGAMAREQAVALRQAAPVRTLLARVLRVHTAERAWRIGADGEEMVAARLAKLARKDSRWRYLHAIPVGENGSDIDHVVIGPGGVFTLNAKHHPGARIWIRGNAFRVNGTQVPYVRNSRHEAARASRYLTVACGFPVDVSGIVVPVGANAVTIKEAPTGVHVVNRMALAAWLRSRPQVLDDDRVLAVFEAARRSTTWQRGAGRSPGEGPPIA